MVWLHKEQYNLELTLVNSKYETNSNKISSWLALYPSYKAYYS